MILPVRLRVRLTSKIILCLNLSRLHSNLSGPAPVFNPSIRLLRQAAAIIQRLQSQEPRRRAKFLFDAQQLVVFGDAVGARG